ncbi:hypothetical protein [Oryza sativa Japonica Group]|uniref:Uncharacterized protein n=1 Tax=Oryza sativa subsp. japonica TaxID=39947 RepID=Q5ZAU7_ORYSJ|nr:hypothetical protein [Oryza sativa Japonica Group]
MVFADVSKGNQRRQAGPARQRHKGAAHGGPSPHVASGARPPRGRPRSARSRSDGHEAARLGHGHGTRPAWLSHGAAAAHERKRRRGAARGGVRAAQASGAAASRPADLTVAAHGPVVAGGGHRRGSAHGRQRREARWERRSSPRTRRRGMGKGGEARRRRSSGRRRNGGPAAFREREPADGGRKDRREGNRVPAGSRP